MSDTRETGNKSNDNIDEKELIDIFNNIDDDLINRQIDELLAEKGEDFNMNNLKDKAFKKLENGKRKRSIGKKVAIIAAAATLTVSTVYASDIQTAIKSFLGKSTFYQTVVDGDAYYLPEEIVLNDKYTLKYANMSEGELELLIKPSEQKSEDWFGDLNFSLMLSNGDEEYTNGGYGYIDGALNLFYYKLPTLKEFDISLEGELYSISLTKADSLIVDENLVVGVPELTQDTDKISSENSFDSVETLELIANVAASRTDEMINIVVGLEDRDLKLDYFGKNKNENVFIGNFENVSSDSVIASNSGVIKNPLMAYDSENNAYELKEPENAIGRPVTVFEIDAESGTPLTLKIPELGTHYEKEVDRITVAIPKEGEMEIEEEIDFIIQKAVAKTIKRTSETTAEIVFDINTGADKSVKIWSMSEYSKDVIKGESIITDDKAVLTLTFDESTENVEIEFSWPFFIIEGNWSIELE